MNCFSEETQHTRYIAEINTRNPIYIRQLCDGTRRPFTVMLRDSQTKPSIEGKKQRVSWENSERAFFLLRDNVLLHYETIRMGSFSIF